MNTMKNVTAKNTALNKGKKNAKSKVNKKRLFFVFFTAFAGFFLLCTLVASMMAPKIDIPAGNEEESLSTMSSDDFKGRVDSSLKSIEAQEETGPATSSVTSSTTSTTAGNTTAAPAQKETSEQVPVNNQKTVTKQQPQYSQEDDYEQIPYDSRNDTRSYNYDQPAPQPAPQPQPQVQQPAQPTLILRDKVRPEQTSY